MARTIAKCIGIDIRREKAAHRLGSVASQVQAATWHTFLNAKVEASGAGRVWVVRDGKVIHEWEIGPEDPNDDQ